MPRFDKISALFEENKGDIVGTCEVNNEGKLKTVTDEYKSVLMKRNKKNEAVTRTYAYIVRGIKLMK